MTDKITKIEQWKSTIAHSNCKLLATKTLNTICKKNGDHLFSLLDVDVQAPEGYKLPHILFIRGHACIIVPEIINSDNGERAFLMVRQYRIGNGRISLEFPAGMLDEAYDDPEGIALKELREETGLTIKKEELFLLSDKPLYSSAGASDEAIYFYGCTLQRDTSVFEKLKNAKTGVAEENEHISVELLTRKTAEPQISSVAARLGFFLYEQYRTAHNLA